MQSSLDQDGRSCVRIDGLHGTFWPASEELPVIWLPRPNFLNQYCITLGNLWFYVMVDVLQHTIIKLLALAVKLEMCDFGRMDDLGFDRNSRDQICEVLPHVPSKALVRLKQQGVRVRCLHQKSLHAKETIAIQIWAFLLIAAAVAMTKGGSGA